MKKVVKPRNLLGFKIWLEKLGCVVNQSVNGFTANTNNRFIKRRHKHVLVTNDLGGNQAAYELGAEFEDHLASPDFIEVVA